MASGQLGDPVGELPASMAVEPLTHRQALAQEQFAVLSKVEERHFE